MKKSRKIIAIAALAVLALFAAAAVNGKGSAPAAEAEPATKGVPIGAATVEARALAATIRYSGRIEPGTSAILSPKMTAEVLEVLVSAGDRVEEGQVLARLDDSQLRASRQTLASKMETARISRNHLAGEVATYEEESPALKAIEKLEADHSYRSQDLEKMAILLEEGIVSQSAYDELAHQVAQLERQIGEAKASSDNAYDTLKNQADTVSSQLNELAAALGEIDLAIGNAVITAPMDGVVRTVYYSQGDLAAAGKPLAILDETSVMTAQVAVPESDLARIVPGGSVDILVPGREEALSASVTKILPQLDPRTGTGTVEVDLDGAAAELAAGSSIQAAFIVAEAGEGPVLPESAVVEEAEGTYVYVIEEGKAVKREVATGIQAEGLLQVLSGVAAGESIAVKNLGKLYDGAPVYIYEGVSQE